MILTACQLSFTRLKGSCCPSVSMVEHISCFVLCSMLSWGKSICWRGWWRDWLQVCVLLGSPDSMSVLQRDRGFVSAAASDIFAWALCCSEYFRGALSAWPTWKYGYRRTCNTNSTNTLQGKQHIKNGKNIQKNLKQYVQNGAIAKIIGLTRT